MNILGKIKLLVFKEIKKLQERKKKVLKVGAKYLNTIEKKKERITLVMIKQKYWYLKKLKSCKKGRRRIRK